MLEGWYGRWRPGLADSFCAWPYLHSHKCIQIGQSCSLKVAGEQLLEAMMAQGLAPSIYTLSVVVKYLGSIDSTRVVSCRKPSLLSQHAFKVSIAFWANKHESTLPNQWGDRRFTKKMRDHVSKRLGNVSWHPNEMTSFANDGSNIVKIISSLLWISHLILCYFLLLILCHSLAKSRIHTCNATLKIWNAQAACQCQAVGQGFQESQQQEVWGETMECTSWQASNKMKVSLSCVTPVPI